MNVKNDITVYEVKTISPTKVIVAKVAINVKNFYNNVSTSIIVHAITKIIIFL